jgi:hypothetical protein
MVTEKIQVLVREIAELTKTLVHQVAHVACDSLRACFLSHRLVKLHQTLYTEWLTYRSSFQNIPSVLFLMVAKMNENPSLYSMSLTCKKWYDLAHTPRHCMEWTRGVYRMSILPLMELQLMEPPRKLSKQAIKQTEKYVFFDSTEGLEARRSRLIHHKGGRKRALLQEFDNGVMSAHLTSSHMCVLETVQCLGTYCLTMTERTTDGFFANSYCYIKSFTVDHLSPMHARVHESDIEHCAWSDTSLFLLLKNRTQGGAIVEYDIPSWVEKQRYDVTLLLGQMGNYSSGCIVWFSGVLLFGVTPITNAHEKIIQLTLIHWETREVITLPAGNGNENCLLASLKLRGSPSAYVSLHSDPGEIFIRRLHVWSSGGGNATRGAAV